MKVFRGKISGHYALNRVFFDGFLSPGNSTIGNVGASNVNHVVFLGQPLTTQQATKFWVRAQLWIEFIFRIRPKC